MLMKEEKYSYVKGYRFVGNYDYNPKSIALPERWEVSITQTSPISEELRILQDSCPIFERIAYYRISGRMSSRESEYRGLFSVLRGPAVRHRFGEVARRWRKLGGRIPGHRQWDWNVTEY
jgi:hypothetical protein